SYSGLACKKNSVNLLLTGQLTNSLFQLRVHPCDRFINRNIHTYGFGVPDWRKQLFGSFPCPKCCHMISWFHTGCQKFSKFPCLVYFRYQVRTNPMMLKLLRCPLPDDRKLRFPKAPYIHFFLIKENKPFLY